MRIKRGKEKYRKGVFVVVYAQEKNSKQDKNKIKYLLLHRKLHWKGWEFPKGGKRFYETNKMTVIREIKEEVGLPILKINKHDFSGKYQYDKIYEDRHNIIGQTFKLYSVEVKKYGKEKIRLDKLEHDDYKWSDFKKALKLLTWDNQKKSLKIINNYLKRKIKS